MSIFKEPTKTYAAYRDRSRSGLDTLFEKHPRLASGGYMAWFGIVFIGVGWGLAHVFVARMGGTWPDHTLYDVILDQIGQVGGVVVAIQLVLKYKNMKKTKEAGNGG